MANYSFPSLGQTLRFAVDALGVLPRKRSGECDGLDETDKKRIQKKLQRLASEKGRLEDNLHETVRELSDILGLALQSDEIRFAICETLWDVYEVYKATIKSDGTFLSERETIEWFCFRHAIPRLVFSVSKHMLRLNLSGRGLIYPSDEDWYLPSVIDGHISWPLAKVMHWVYKLLDLSQERFHYSDRRSEAHHDAQRQNLENARKWVRGRNTPSWSSLRWTFSCAFEELAEFEGEPGRSDLPEAFRENIYYILFIARFSTDLCKRIEKAHGAAFLEQCIAKYQQQRQWLVGEVECNRHLVQQALDRMEGSVLKHDAVWYDWSERYWVSLADRMPECWARVDEIFRRRGKVQDVEAAEEWLIHQFGKYPARMCLAYLHDQKYLTVPEGFLESFKRALELKSSAATESDIDEYEADLRQRDLEKRLQWVCPWLRAVIRYKDEDYEGAMEVAEQAFNLAKYSAGEKQYNLVNLYVELAAKNKDKKRFKKGVEWARFIGVEIRWLRDDEPTESNLDFVFAMLERARYFQF